MRHAHGSHIQLCTNLVGGAARQPHAHWTVETLHAMHPIPELAWVSSRSPAWRSATVTVG